jgi:hypothetical protein
MGRPVRHNTGLQRARPDGELGRHDTLGSLGCAMPTHGMHLWSRHDPIRLGLCRSGQSVYQARRAGLGTRAIPVHCSIIVVMRCSTLCATPPRTSAPQPCVSATADEHASTLFARRESLPGGERDQGLVDVGDWGRGAIWKRSREGGDAKSVKP